MIAIVDTGGANIASVTNALERLKLESKLTSDKREIETASHVILPRLAGLSKATELLLSGRTILGTEAVEYGIATRAFPAQQVLPAAMELAREIAVYAAPLPVAIAKRLIWEGIGIDLAKWREREGKLFRFSTRHPDAREGTVAFFERRVPRWSGSVNKEFPDWPE